MNERGCTSGGGGNSVAAPVLREGRCVNGACRKAFWEGGGAYERCLGFITGSDANVGIVLSLAFHSWAAGVDVEIKL